MDELKKVICSILVSSPCVMMIRRLDYVYKGHCGQRIPYRNFGYSSVTECLNSMSDILKVQGSGKNAVVIVNASIKAAHIARFGSQPQQRGSAAAFLKADTPHHSSSGSLDASHSVFVDSQQNQIAYIVNVPLDIQQNLQKIIKKHNKGIWCAQLPSLYKDMFNKELDYKEYRYRALSLMCSDLKYIFHVIRPGICDFVLFDATKPVPIDLFSQFTDSPSSLCNKEVIHFTDPALPDLTGLFIYKVEREVYPKGVMQPGDIIPRQFVPDDISENEYIDVVVGEVYDPSKFWLILEKKIRELESLVDDLHNYCAANEKKLQIPTYGMKQNLYCAAKYLNEYHRALIVDISALNTDAKVKIFYIDYGTTSFVSCKGICYLHTSFAMFPAQAIRARLAQIYPPVKDVQWSTEATQRVFDMTSMKTLVAQVFKIYKEKQVIHVFLVDTSTDEDIYIHDTLVKEGHAKFTNQEQDIAQRDSHFLPIVEWLYAYPTFEELETGRVPNSDETIALLNAGSMLPSLYQQYFKTLPLEIQSEEFDYDTNLATPVDEGTPNDAKNFDCTDLCSKESAISEKRVAEQCSSSISTSLMDNQVMHGGDVSRKKESPNKAETMYGKLVMKIDAYNLPIHVIRWENNVHVSIRDILQFTRCKDAELYMIRKLVLLKDTTVSNSIKYIRLKDHRELQEELAQHNIFDEVHVAPASFISDIVTILGIDQEEMNNYEDFIEKLRLIVTCG